MKMAISISNATKSPGNSDLTNTPKPNPPKPWLPWIKKRQLGELAAYRERNSQYGGIA